MFLCWHSGDAAGAAVHDYYIIILVLCVYAFKINIGRPESFSREKYARNLNSSLFSVDNGETATEEEEEEEKGIGRYTSVFCGRFSIVNPILSYLSWPAAVVLHRYTPYTSYTSYVYTHNIDASKVGGQQYNSRYFSSLVAEYAHGNTHYLYPSTPILYTRMYVRV